MAESQKSWHQKLIVGQDPNAEEEWSLEDFTIDGTTITGLSESGMEKLKTDKSMILPDRNAQGEYITEIADTTNGTGLFATEEEKIESVVLPTYLERIGNRAFCNSGASERYLPEYHIKRDRFGSVPDERTEKRSASGQRDNVRRRGICHQPAAGRTCSVQGTDGDSGRRFRMQHGRRMDGKPDPGCDPGRNRYHRQQCLCRHNFTEINIPSTVKEIGSYAFSTKNYLKDTICTITLPEGLEDYRRLCVPQ